MSLFSYVVESQEEIPDTNPELYVRRARQATEELRFEDAIREMDDAIRFSEEPKSVDYLCTKIILLARANHQAECLRVIEASLLTVHRVLGMDKAKQLVQLAARVADLKDTLPAGRILYDSLLTNKSLSFSLDGIELAWLATKAFQLIDRRLLSEAREFIHLAVSMGERKDIYIKAAKRCEANRFLDEAYRYFQLAIQGEPDNVFHVLATVVFLNENKRLDESLLVLNTALQSHADNRILILAKVRTLAGLERYREAKAELSGFLAVHQVEAETSFLLASIHDGLKEYRLAHKYYRTANRLNASYVAPENAERLHALHRHRISVLTAGLFALIVMACVAVVQYHMFVAGVILKPLIYDAQIHGKLHVSEGATTKVTQTVQVFPPYAKRPELHWEIPESSVAVVDDKGIVTGLNDGIATLRLMNGNQLLLERAVRVYELSGTKTDGQGDGTSAEGGFDDGGTIGGDVGGYLLPWSDRMYLSDDDMQSIAPDMYPYARNEIFARHGYVFQTEKYADYFGNKPWYEPGKTGDNIHLNVFEEYNVEFILSYEKRNDSDMDTERLPAEGVGSGTSLVDEESDSSPTENVYYWNDSYQYEIAYPDSFHYMYDYENSDGAYFSNVVDGSQLLVLGYGNEAHLDVSDVLNEAVIEVSSDDFYQYAQDDWFVLSWEKDGTIYYQRTIVGTDSIVMYRLAYPETLKAAYDETIQILSDSFAVYSSGY